MVKYFLLFLGSLFSCSHSFAQAPTIQWQKTLGGTGNDQDRSVQQTADGGYIFAANTNSTDGDVIGNHGGIDFWIVKLNSTGTIQWQKTLGGTGTDVPLTIKQTTDGGYIIGGYTYSTDGDVTGNHGDADVWIVKINSTGTIQWQKTLGGTGDDQGRSIELTPDGGYIINGFTNSTNGDVTGNHGGYDAWILKLNNAGMIQWQKTMGGTGNEKNFTTSMPQISGGGYIILNYTTSNDGDVSGNHGGNDVWVVKLNSEILPIELRSFQAQNTEGGNLLTWQTASEINTNHFDIERSTDGKIFDKIGELKAQNKAAHYNYLDKSIINSTVYYRLKINDLDGTINYSNIVSITNKNKGLIIKVFPNPFNDNFNVDISTEKKAELTIDLIDILGRSMRHFTFYTEGSSNFPISTKDLPSGAYFLKISDGQSVLQQKLMKSK